MRLAHVIVDIPARAIDRAFSYLVPESLHGIEVGCPVLVDFAHRMAVGYVTGIEEAPSDLDVSAYKFIERVLGAPYFDEYSARVASWIAHAYAAPLSEAFHLLAPPGGAPKARKVTHEGEEVWELKTPDTGPVDDRWVRITPEGRDFTPPRTAVKQRAVLEALKEGEMRIGELSLQVGAVNACVKALEKRGFVVCEHRRRIRGDMPDLPRDAETVTLTSGQQSAVDTIMELHRKHDGSVVVCDGVTGSGKTEVYLRVIRRILEQGGGAIVLVPEISLTPQTVGRFRARFGDTVAVIHSRLSVGERYDQWDLIRSGTARVVVGARSALFSPIHNLQLIVIDEEHESSYKQGQSPRYNARDVAAQMMKVRGGTVVLGSATPSSEALYACDTGRWTHVVLPERATANPLPPVEVIDMAHEFGSGHRSMFSRSLTAALHETIERGEKAVLLLNQRGFASFLLCRECGYVPRCDSCSTSLTYHEGRGTAGYLECHQCGAKKDVPTTCPECGSPYLKKFGAGTQRVQDELVALLGPDVPVVRMDADTTRTKGAHAKLLEEFEAAETGVLLGTQMIAKGLDFPEVTLVGVINADTSLNLPDFRAGERTYHLLEQVSGRAGRGEKGGRVFIQTYWPTHPAILAAKSHNRSPFWEPEQQTRRQLSYPPFSHLANILLWSSDKKDVALQASGLGRELMAAIADAGKSWQVLGPSPCVIARRKNDWRWHLLIKCPLEDDVAGLIGDVLKAHKGSAATNISVDIDPYDLM